MELFGSYGGTHRVHGWGVRRLSKVHRVHRRLVRQALHTALPPPRPVPAREAPVLGTAKPFIEAVLATDREAPRKQQHTAHRIWERIRASWGSRWRSRPCASTWGVASGSCSDQPK